MGDKYFQLFKKYVLGCIDGIERPVITESVKSLLESAGDPHMMYARVKPLFNGILEEFAQGSSQGDLFVRTGRITFSKCYEFPSVYVTVIDTDDMQGWFLTQNFTGCAVVSDGVCDNCLILTNLLAEKNHLFYKFKYFVRNEIRLEANINPLPAVRKAFEDCEGSKRDYIQLKRIFDTVRSRVVVQDKINYLVGNSGMISLAVCPINTSLFIVVLDTKPVKGWFILDCEYERCAVPSSISGEISKLQKMLNECEDTSSSISSEVDSYITSQTIRCPVTEFLRLARLAGVNTDKVEEELYTYAVAKYKDVTRAVAKIIREDLT